MPMIDSARHAHDHQGCPHSHLRRDGCRDTLYPLLRHQWDAERPDAGVNRPRCLGASGVLWERGKCPLTALAQHYANPKGYVGDVFLPEWLARRTFLIFTSLSVIGLLLVLVRVLSRE